MESLKKRVYNAQKKPRAAIKAKDQLAVMGALKVLNGKPARAMYALSHEDAAILKGLQLVTAKPVLYVANVAEEDAATGNAHSARLAEKAKAERHGMRWRRAAIRRKSPCSRQMKIRKSFWMRWALTSRA